MKTGLVALLIAIVGFVFFSYASFPGFMSPDSFSQYSQALSHQYTDTHPPVMSWVWSNLNLIFDGPQSMLYLQLLLLWGGLYCWSLNFAGRAIAIGFMLVGFAPWVANFESVIWKDVQMAASLVLVTALLARERLGVGSVIAIVLLSFYAFMVRTNAPAALLPIIWFALARIPAVTSPGRRSVATLGAIAGMFLLNQFFTYQVLDAEKGHIVDFMMTDDLVKLSVVEGRSLLPGVDFETVRECSQEVIGETVLVGRVFCLSNKSSYLNAQPISHEAMQRVWVDAILRNPLEMIAHRIRAFGYLLRGPSEKPYIYFYASVQGGNLNIPARDNDATYILTRYVKEVAAKAPFLFKPYSWLIYGLAILLATFVAGLKGPTVNQARMLVLSGIFYLLGYLPLAPMADFRYAYWTTISMTLATLLLLTSLKWRRGVGNAGIEEARRCAGETSRIGRLALIRGVDAIFSRG